MRFLSPCYVAATVAPAAGVPVVVATAVAAVVIFFWPHFSFMVVVTSDLSPHNLVKVCLAFPYNNNFLSV